MARAEQKVSSIPKQEKSVEKNLSAMFVLRPNSSVSGYRSVHGLYEVLYFGLTQRLLYYTLHQHPAQVKSI